MSYLEEIKIRLNIENNEKDKILNSYLNQAKEKIINYCNITSIPKELKYTLISIAIELYRYNNGELQISSETQGNRSVTYSDISVLDKIILNYNHELNRFRRIKVI